MLLISTTIKRGCHVSSFLRENGGTRHGRALILTPLRRCSGGQNSYFGPQDARQRACRQGASPGPKRPQPTDGTRRLSVGPGPAVLLPPSCPVRPNAIFKASRRKNSP